MFYRTTSPEARNPKQYPNPSSEPAKKQEDKKQRKRGKTFG